MKAKTLVCIAAFLALSACDQVRQVSGLEKQSPDEFVVVTRAPLSLPPDYGLRPPRPGAERPQETQVTTAARDLLVPRSQDEAPGSPGEAKLLEASGAADADPDIRLKLDRDASILSAEDKGFVERILSRDDPRSGSVVDAKREAERLQENAELGKAPTEGATPRIERRSRGWLEGLFN